MMAQINTPVPNVPKPPHALETFVCAQPAGAFTVADEAKHSVVEPVEADHITFTKGTEFTIEGFCQLFVNFDPSYTGDKTIQWSVDDATKAKVDKHGVVTTELSDNSSVTVTAKLKADPTTTIDATVYLGAAKLTAAGDLEISVDGKKTWVAAIPATLLKVDTYVEFDVRTKSVTPADDTSYAYLYQMVPDKTGEKPGQTNTTGIGGLSMIVNADHTAHVAGKVPANFVGFAFTIECHVVDSYDTKKTAKKLTGTWSAATSPAPAPTK